MASTVSMLYLLHLVCLGQTPLVDGSWTTNDIHSANTTERGLLNDAITVSDNSEIKPISRDEISRHLGDFRSDVVDRESNSSGNITLDSRVPDDSLSIIHFGSISQVTYESLKYALDIAAVPVVIIVGLCGNVAAIRTLLSERSRYPITVYLIYLTITDTIVIISFFMTWFADVVTLHNQSLGIEIQAALFIPVSLMLQMITRKASAFITVILSVERTIAMKFPLRIKTTFLNQHPRKVLAAMFSFVLLFFLPNIFFYEVIVSPNTETNEPIIAVFVCNAIIIKNVQKSEINRKQIASSSQAEMSVTRLLVSISMLFLICNIPGTVLIILMRFVDNFGFHQREHYLLLTVRTISNFFNIINSSANFIAYMLVSKKFRETFIQTWRCERDKHPREVGESGEKLDAISDTGQYSTRSSKY